MLFRGPRISKLTTYIPRLRTNTPCITDLYTIGEVHRCIACNKRSVLRIDRVEIQIEI